MAVDRKITPQSVLFQTTSKLRGAITQGEFAPGERLIERTLAAMMRVSRTTLREALRRLEWERLVSMSVISASNVHRNANRAVNSASAAPHYFVRHSVERVVQCFTHSNMRDVLKQNAFLLL